MPPDPKLGSFFCHSLAYLSTLVDVLDVLRLRARCSQAMSNFQILEFPAGPAHSTRLPTHLIWVPKEGLALHLPISLRGWATPTLKSFKLCQKHGHIKKVLKNIVWPTIFCPTTQFCRVVRWPLFSEHP